MKRLILVLMMMFLCTLAFADPDTPPGSYYSPQEVQNRVMDRATSGIRTQGLAPRTIGNGQLTIETAGTAERLSNDTSIVRVEVKGFPDNKGYIYIGDSNVDSLNGYTLSKDTDSVVLLIDSLIDVYVDVEISGEKVSFIYFRK